MMINDNNTNNTSTNNPSKPTSSVVVPSVATPPPAPPPQPQDVLQTFLDTISSSLTTRMTTSGTGEEGGCGGESPSVHRLPYTKDRIDISSMTTLQELLSSSAVAPVEVVVGTDQHHRGISTSTATSGTTGRIPSNNNVHMVEQQQQHQHDAELVLQMTPVERHMYQQIQINTRLLQDLQQSMNHITTLLSHHHHHQQQQQQQSSSVVVSTLPLSLSGIRTTAVGNVARGLQQLQQQQPVTPSMATTTTVAASAAVSPPPPPKGIWFRLRHRVPDMMRNMVWDNPFTIVLRKLIYLEMLYFTLYHRYHQQQRQQARRNNPNQNQNNNFDPFMIFKVIFMMIILWSRIQQRSSHDDSSRSGSGDTTDDNTEEEDWQQIMYLLKLCCVAIMITAFVLYRAGVWTFLYLFWYKYKIPQRVFVQSWRRRWHNEEATVRPPQPAQPPRDTGDDTTTVPNDANANTNNNNNNNMITADAIWEEHLLAVAEENRIAREQRDGNIEGNNPNIINNNNNNNRNHPPNPVTLWIQQVRHRIQWLLVHDWFHGQPIVPVVQPQNRGPLPPQPPPHPAEVAVSPITRMIRMVLTMIQDIIVFMVSFILSILPIWRNIDPQALFNVFRQQQQGQLDYGDGAAPQQQQQPNRNNNNDGGIPFVQPPIDPVE